MAVGAGDEFFGGGFGCEFFFVDFGFGGGVEAFGVEPAGSDEPIAAAGGAPSSWGVEREVMRIEFFERFSSNWRDARSGEGVESEV